MRLYMADGSRGTLAKCRKRAPSHAYGRVWTPNHRKFGTPYIVDNGVYQATMNDEPWSAERWIIRDCEIECLDFSPQPRQGSRSGIQNGTLSTAISNNLLNKTVEHPWPPDFVVLPDVYNDAKATLARHREYIDEILDRGFRPAAVLQPGMDEATQVELADRLGAQVVFVGGDNRWKRAHGEEIVTYAHERNLAVHIGNPGVPGGLRWAQRIGADSIDTASIVASQAYHHLDELEGHSKGVGLKNGKQSKLSTSKEIARE